jgi:hypothetical protein
MNTRLLFLVLLIVCFSCGTNNKPVSDAQKEKIKGEIKEIVNTGFKGCEEVNPDMATGLFLDSPDFIFINNENSYDYKQLINAVKQTFSTLINQKITVNEEKFVFLDKSKAIYATKGKVLSNFKDGHAILSEPLITQFTFEKINNKWVAINLVQTSVDKPVKNTELSKELNLVELNNQLIGSWKFDYSKDTTGFIDFVTYGNGIDGTIRYVSGGKPVMEIRINWGYDKNLDKMVGLQQIKGGDIALLSGHFISKNKYLLVNYKDISNPENASWKIEGEFISPNSLKETTIVNNRPVAANTYTRVK